MAALVALGAGTAGAGVERQRLSSGLTLIVAPRAGASAVAAQAWVGVGAADESARRAGIAHVFEHMLFKGTERRGVGAIARAIESAGGDINAWTAFDETVFHVVLGRRHLDTGLDVLGDALAHSSFDAGELEREREVILEEIRQGEDDSLRAVAQQLFSTTFHAHPYRRPIIGDAAVVRGLRRRDLVDFHRRHYRGDNVTLVVAGDVDPGDVSERVERHFRGLRAEPSPPRKRRPREPAQRGLRVAASARDVSESHLALGYRVPPIEAADTAALDVAAVVLGQGEASRLGARLQRGDELVTGVHAYVHALRDTGLFLVGASAVPARLPAALEAIGEEIARLAREELSVREIGRAVHAIEADAVYQSETVEALARQIGAHHALTGDPGFARRYLASIRAVTPARLRAAAETYLSVDGATLSAVLPESRRLATEAGRERARTRLAGLVRRGAARAARQFAVAAAPAAHTGGVIRERLPSGVRVVIERDTSVPLVAARAVWLGGSRLESESNNGVNHLIAGLLTRGCGELDADQVIEEVDAAAGSLAGFSGRNALGLRIEWLAGDWDRGFELFADCLLSPRFPARELEREKQRTLEDLEARGDSPSSLVFRDLAETLYRRHPYRLDPMGTPASIRAMTRRRLTGYYRLTYPPSELTISVVGDVDPARVLRRLRERFGDGAWPTRPERRIPEEPTAPRREAERQVFRTLDRQQAHVAVGFPGLTVRDPDRHALEVLVTVLGGQSGRLFLELRDRQALAYRVGAFSIEGVDPGYVAVFLATSPDKLDAAVAGIRGELDAVARDGVGADEVERAVRYLVGTHEIALQRRSSVAAALAFYEAYGLGVAEHARYAEAIESVTAADVQRVARRIFDGQRAVIATVAPPAMSPEAARRARGTRRRPPRRRAR